MVNRGYIRLELNLQGKELKVVVKEARNLPPMDLNGFADPYVKLYIRPGDRKQKTRVMKKTLNPLFNETFHLKIPDPSKNRLEVHVWDYDWGSKNDFMGRVVIPVSDIGKEATTKWFVLKDEDDTTLEALEQAPTLVSETDKKIQAVRERAKREPSRSSQSTKEMAFQYIAKGYLQKSPHSTIKVLEKKKKRYTWPWLFVSVDTFCFRLFAPKEDDNVAEQVLKIPLCSIRGLILEKNDPWNRSFVIEYAIDAAHKSSSSGLLNLNLGVTRTLTGNQAAKGTHRILLRTYKEEDVTSWMDIISKAKEDFEAIDHDPQTIAHLHEHEDEFFIDLPADVAISPVIEEEKTVRMLSVKNPDGSERIISQCCEDGEEYVIKPFVRGATVKMYLDHDQVEVIENKQLVEKKSCKISMSAMSSMKAMWTHSFELADVPEKTHDVVDTAGPVFLVACIATGLSIIGPPKEMFDPKIIFYLVACVLIIWNVLSKAPKNGKKEPCLKLQLHHETNNLDDFNEAPAETILINTQEKSHTEGWGTWGPAECDGIKLRGKNYLVDKKKFPATNTALRLGKVEFFNANEKLTNAAKHSEWIKAWREQFPAEKVEGAVTKENIKNMVFCLNWLIPANPWWNLVCYCTYNADNPEDEVWLDTMAKFVNGDREYQDKRFKLIPRVVEGSWLVKKSVGTTPAILGKKLKQDYYLDKENNVFTVEVDVGSSSVAGSILGMVKGAAKALVIDLFVLIEGQDESSLPERLMSGVRMVHCDLNSIPSKVM